MNLPSLSDDRLDLLHHEASALAFAKAGGLIGTPELTKVFPRLYLREVLRILTQEINNV